MDSLRRWQPGNQIVQYELWGDGIGTARPVTVVLDHAGQLVLYSHPETTISTRVLADRHALCVSDRIDVYMATLDPSVGVFEERVSSGDHVLTITPPDRWHSVWLFWTREWQLKTWYVNLQSPLRRPGRGVAFHDYALDLVVRPDLSWSWKDVDEFEELISRGFFTTDQVTAIRAEADRMIETIESVGPPFRDGWEVWRPDARWPKPVLPDDWSGMSGENS